MARFISAAFVAAMIIGGFVSSAYAAGSVEAVVAQGLLQQVLEQNPNGETTEAVDPDGQFTIRITPIWTQNGGELPCRGYTQTIVPTTLAGAKKAPKVKQAGGVMCRDPSGFWKTGRIGGQQVRQQQQVGGQHEAVCTDKFARTNTRIVDPGKSVERALRSRRSGSTNLIDMVLGATPGVVSGLFGATKTTNGVSCTQKYGQTREPVGPSDWQQP